MSLGIEYKDFSLEIATGKMNNIRFKNSQGEPINSVNVHIRCDISENEVAINDRTNPQNPIREEIKVKKGETYTTTRDFFGSPIIFIGK